MPIFQKINRYGDTAKPHGKGMFWRFNLIAQFGCFVRMKLISITPPGQFLFRPEHLHV